VVRFTFWYVLYRRMPLNYIIYAACLHVVYIWQFMYSLSSRKKNPAFWACPIISDVIKGMIKFSKLFICLLFFVLTCYYVFITGKLTKMSLGKWWHWCDPIIDKELPIGMVYALDVRFVNRWKMVDWSSTFFWRGWEWTSTLW